MKLFSIYSGAEAAGQREAEIEILRDGFSFAAFLASGLWLVWHRLWREFAIFAALAAGIAFVAQAFAPGTALGLAMLLALYLGVEAAPIRERALIRRGFAHRADLAARNEGEAELLWRLGRRP